MTEFEADGERLSETGPARYHEAGSHGEGWRPAGYSDPRQYACQHAINERHARSCSRCNMILTRTGVPRIFASLTQNGKR